MLNSMEHPNKEYLLTMHLVTVGDSAQSQSATSESLSSPELVTPPSPSLSHQSAPLPSGQQGGNFPGAPQARACPHCMLTRPTQ